MSQIAKFPDMRPRGPRPAINLPTPSGYRQTVPVFPVAAPDRESLRVERKRLVLWFGVAVALHAALLLGWWLLPPLRLKWGPASDAWVPVTSLPMPMPMPKPKPEPSPGVQPSRGPRPARAQPPISPVVPIMPLYDVDPPSFSKKRSP